MKSLSKIVFAGISLATVMAFASAQAADDIETPKFEVLHSGQNVELRQYQPMIVAEVTVEAENREAASSKGFMPLAGYIFGKNRPGEKIDMTAPVTTEIVTSQTSGGGIPSGDGQKIAMTAPVTTEQNEENRYTVRFTMPSKWTMDTLPAPQNKAIRLIEVPGRKILASGFTGENTQEKQDDARARIEDYAKKNNLKLESSFSIAGYDGPDVPQSERRWEIMASLTE